MCVIVGGGGAGRNGVPNGIYVTCLEPAAGQHSDGGRGPGGPGGGPGALAFRHPGHSVVDTGPDLPFAVALSSRLGLVACSFGGVVRLYALRAAEVGMDIVYDFQADYGEVPDISLVRFNEGHDPDGTAEDRVLTCGSDRTVRVFSIRPVGDTKARVHCDAELIGSVKDINDIHSCSFRGSDGNTWLAVAVASDDGKLRLWSVPPPAAAAGDDAASPAAASPSSSPTGAGPAPSAVYETLEDGNTHPRAGGRIWKNVRFGSARPADAKNHSDGTLLFAVQSRMNRGSSYLVVWRRAPGATVLQEMKYALASKTLLFPGTGDKAVKLDLPKRRSVNDPYVVCVGSAGGRVCAVQVDPLTGAALVLGEEMRHSLVVSGLAALSFHKQIYVVSTAMDKGAVLQPVRGLVAEAGKRYRKRCCMKFAVALVLLVVAMLGAWKGGYITEEHVEQVSSLFGGGAGAGGDDGGGVGGGGEGVISPAELEMEEVSTGGDAGGEDHSNVGAEEVVDVGAGVQGAEEEEEMVGELDLVASTGGGEEVVEGEGKREEATSAPMGKDGMGSEQGGEPSSGEGEPGAAAAEEKGKEEGEKREEEEERQQQQQQSQGDDIGSEDAGTDDDAGGADSGTADAGEAQEGVDVGSTGGEGVGSTGGGDGGVADALSDTGDAPGEEELTTENGGAQPGVEEL
jgi:hypothetical protein